MYRRRSKQALMAFVAGLTAVLLTHCKISAATTTGRSAAAGVLDTASSSRTSGGSYRGRPSPEFAGWWKGSNRRLSRRTSDKSNTEGRAIAGLNPTLAYEVGVGGHKQGAHQAANDCASGHSERAPWMSMVMRKSMALRGGGSGKGKDRGKGKGRGRTTKDLGRVEQSFESQDSQESRESQESSNDKELDDMHDYEQDSRSDVDIDVDGSASAGDDEGVLDVMARFRGEHKQECKFIIVTGGVLSGIGKGVTASSIGVLCKLMGLRPTAIKIDPYLNVDAGTMSPFEHGEVFVLDDGGETDLDLGNYERFMGVNLRNESNLTTGKIYQYVIEKERRGDYLGKTVQVVPHITDALQDWIVGVSKKPVDNSDQEPDVCIIELGGTLGDIESMPFVEALRQLQDRVGYKNCCFVHVSLVPSLGSPGEQKTKPTQHSIKQMRALGLAPDFLMCRGGKPVVEGARDKLSMFCQVPPERVVSVHDVSNIYHVPLLLLEQNFPALLAQRLRMGPRHSPEACEASAVRLDRASLKRWEDLARRHDDGELSDEAVIGLVGKYTELHDTYLSVVKALLHASLHCKRKLTVKWIDSSALDTTKQHKDPSKHANAWAELKSCHGVLVPGGFGSRGLEGKIQAIKYARKCRVPFLGICLGMQAAVIEFARAKLARENANSAEFAQGLAPQDEVVVFMPEGDRTRMGGTMRLGSRVTVLRPGSRAFELYGGKGTEELEVHERHRHRYEVNPSVVASLEESGMKLVGRNNDGTGERMEVLELEKDAHPYFMGAQYHPEFKSRPQHPSPLFIGLLRAAGRYADDADQSS
ncbi:unnamed protein product [Ectocarpus fasciculatus]